MKKLVAVLLIIFPFVAMGQKPVPDVDVTDILYDMKITIEGGPSGVTSGAKTVQVIKDITWAQYTVNYTALVDALRVILTKTWFLDSTQLPPARIQELIDNPRLLQQQE